MLKKLLGCLAILLVCAPEASSQPAPCDEFQLAAERFECQLARSRNAPFTPWDDRRRVQESFRELQSLRQAFKSRILSWDQASCLYESGILLRIPPTAHVAGFRFHRDANAIDFAAAIVSQVRNSGDGVTLGVFYSVPLSDLRAWTNRDRLSIPTSEMRNDLERRIVPGVHWHSRVIYEVVFAGVSVPAEFICGRSQTSTMSAIRQGILPE